MRSLSMSLAIAAVSLLPAVAASAPATVPSATPADTAVILAQGGPPPGWWEQEGHADELRERYWRLPPPERYRYNELERQIRDLQAREARLRWEQHRILRWGF